MKDKFEFKPGDRVAFGEMEGIIHIRENETFPIEVIFNEPKADIILLTRDGRVSYTHNKPCIRLIERPSQKPKKKVKKTVECWANVYQDFSSGPVWNTKEEADSVYSRSQGMNRIACVRLTGEYEVEE